MGEHPRCSFCGDGRFLDCEEDGAWRCHEVGPCLKRRMALDPQFSRSRSYEPVRCAGCLHLAAWHEDRKGACGWHRGCDCTALTETPAAAPPPPEDPA
jgi:hypothetical protein